MFSKGAVGLEEDIERKGERLEKMLLKLVGMAKLGICVELVTVVMIARCREQVGVTMSMLENGELVGVVVLIFARCEELEGMFMFARWEELGAMIASCEELVEMIPGEVRD